MQRDYPASPILLMIALASVGVFALIGSAVDRVCDRAGYLVMVRLWIPRRTFRGARPLRFQRWAAEGLRELAEAIRRGNEALDRLVSRALVDIWWSAEPAKITPSAKSVPSAIGTPRPSRQKRGLASMAYWATDVDGAWDRAATSAMVDAWLPEPGETLTPSGRRPEQPQSLRRKQAAKRGRAVRRRGWVGAFRRACEELASTAVVQTWLPEPRPEAHAGTDDRGQTHGRDDESAEGPRGWRELWQAARSWGAGPGRTVWRVTLAAAGTVLLVVVLLMALGYLKF